MNDFERVVRQTLRERVSDLPLMADPASGAINRARAVRRRRTVGSAAAAALALFVVVTGLAVAVGRGDDHPAATPASSRGGAGPNLTASADTGPSAVDVTTATTAADRGAIVVGRTVLLLADGRTVALDRIAGGVSEAYLGPDGWLLEGYGDGTTQSLWLLRPDGSLRQLVERSDGPVAVAADGRRFAWRRDGRIRLGHLTTSGDVAAEHDTAAPDVGHPVAIVGDAVVLGRSATGGGLLGYDTWRSERGGYVPTWSATTHVIAVYGPAPDGRSLLGLVAGPGGSKEPCLALLDPTSSLRATTTACGIIRVVSRSGQISPDGRWLAVQSADGSGRGQIAVIDLSTVFVRPAMQTWDEAQEPGAWADSTTMIAVARDGKPVRLRPGQATGQPVPVPNGLPTGEPGGFQPVQTLADRR